MPFRDLGLEQDRGAAIRVSRVDPTRNVIYRFKVVIVPTALSPPELIEIRGGLQVPGIGFCDFFHDWLWGLMTYLFE